MNLKDGILKGTTCLWIGLKEQRDLSSYQELETIHLHCRKTKILKVLLYECGI